MQNKWFYKLAPALHGGDLMWNIADATASYIRNQPSLCCETASGKNNSVMNYFVYAKNIIITSNYDLSGRNTEFPWYSKINLLQFSCQQFVTLRYACHFSNVQFERDHK